MKQKKWKWIGLLGVLSLMLTGCYDFTEYDIRGVLYEDTTYQVPVEGAMLRFSTASQVDEGYAITDAQGRWGYHLVYNVHENPYFASTKTSIDPPLGLILWGDDTLFFGDLQGAIWDTLRLSLDTCLGGGWLW